MKKHEIGILILVLTAVAFWGMILPVSGQEKAKPQVAVKEAREFAIARLVVGTGVENKEPVGIAETFPASTEKVFCFLEATNIAQDTEISFVWLHGQKEMLKVLLPLKMGPKWRTYAHKNLAGLKGDWTVEIRSADGNLVKDIKFKAE